MSNAIYRLNKIYECIENIEFIVNTSDLKIIRYNLPIFKVTIEKLLNL
jgi:hypothetical protein